jgi:hypothetical protein
MRTPAKTPTTPPMPLNRSDSSPSELAPQSVGTKPPISIPKVAHIMMAERPMGN